MRRAIPKSIADIDDAWLSCALNEAAWVDVDEPVRIHSHDRVGADSAFGGTLFRIAYHAAGATGSVIVKLPAVEAPTRAVHEVVGSYRRELAFYRDIAGGTAPAPVRTPRPIVAEAAEDSTDTVLVLEDLAPLAVADQRIGLSREQAKTVIDAFAAMHAWAWERPLLDTVGRAFPRMDSEEAAKVWSLFGQVCTAAWPALADRLGDEIPADVAAVCDRFAELIPFFVGELSSPRTIIHGEPRSDNLFIDSDGDPIFIDFQMAAQGSGAFDIAYVISQSVPTEVRRPVEESLVRRWWEGLRAGGVEDYEWKQAWRQYRIATVWGLVYPLLVSTRWDGAGPDGRFLLDEMFRRGATCVSDLDATALLPA